MISKKKMTKDQFIRFANRAMSLVPSIQHVAVDKSGWVYGYKERPGHGETAWWCEGDGPAGGILLDAIQPEFVWSTVLVSSNVYETFSRKEYKKWAMKMLRHFRLFKHVAVDGDGTVYMFTKRPKYSHGGWYQPIDSSVHSIEIARITALFNSKDSLVSLGGQ